MGSLQSTIETAIAWTYIFAAIAHVMSVIAGGYVATEKNRSVSEGFFFGLFLGPIGVLIVACLPTLVREPLQPFTPVELPPARNPRDDAAAAFAAAAAAPVRNPHDAAVAAVAARKAAPVPVATAPWKPPVVAEDAVPARAVPEPDDSNQGVLDDTAATAWLAALDHKAKPLRRAVRPAAPKEAL